VFGELLRRMDIVELDESELVQPISVTEHGDMATVANLIAEKAPPDIRGLFGASATPLQDHIKPIENLVPADLRRVAVTVLERADPTRRVAAMSLGHFSRQELIQEVENYSAMGSRIIDAIRLNGLLVENAITNGQVRPKETRRHLRASNFDF
jgi:hypothetical protein